MHFRKSLFQFVDHFALMDIKISDKKIK